MSTDTSKLRNKIAKLNKSLDELESKLEPLFAQSLDETLLGLDTIQQAKLLVIIPYVVYDLVFGRLGPFFQSQSSSFVTLTVSVMDMCSSLLESSRRRPNDPPRHR